MKQVMCGVLISVFSLTLAGCKTTKVSPTESSVKGTGAIRSLKCLDRGTVYYLLTQYGDLGTSDKVDRLDRPSRELVNMEVLPNESTFRSKFWLFQGKNFPYNWQVDLLSDGTYYRIKTETSDNDIYSATVTTAKSRDGLKSGLKWSMDCNTGDR